MRYERDGRIPRKCEEGPVPFSHAPGRTEWQGADLGAKSARRRPKNPRPEKRLVFFLLPCKLVAWRGRKKSFPPMAVHV
eukprot:scaffold2848_cov352-Pavlova_lutheri.AAC.29